MLLDVWEAHANQDIYILIRLVKVLHVKNAKMQQGFLSVF